jgi:glycosyltransferase involved in cell wall biosynthesis
VVIPEPLDQLLSNPLLAGSLERLMPHVEDAWTAEFPGLRSLPRFDGPARRLRVCIATEDIVGPVRNGGIGTTYAALAELLAQAGQDVTVLYLRGPELDPAELERWIGVYAEKGIRFVPVPDYAEQDRFRSSADRWMRAPYNMLRYLQAHPMDVVHVSEWRGSAYLCLLAKKQGLAFRETLFVVKASSPWMWNRLYGALPLERLDDLAKVHAERQSIELADLVIGGSTHLLRWMLSNGYRIPRERTLVQPNVVSFARLGELLERRLGRAGTRMPIDEIVFFGRLEARKGLPTFCHAINRLIRLGVRLPPRITFMGKLGSRLPFLAGQTNLDYINAVTSHWPVKVQVLNSFQQYEALQYLLDGARLAVMPSLIENSSLAVYEAALCGIPFVASAVGGSPELIDADDHAHVLCESQPIAVADKIAEALERGGYIARPSFDNEANLQVWRDFHLDLGRGLLEDLLQRHLPPPPACGGERVSVCVYSPRGGAALAATLSSLAAQELPSHEVLIAIDCDDAAGAEQIRELAAAQAFPCRTVDCFDLDAGASFNSLARSAAGEYLLFLWEGSTLVSQALQALRRMAVAEHADLLHYLYQSGEGAAGDSSYMSAWIIGSVADSFFSEDLRSLPLFVRRDAFNRLDGFARDFRALSYDREFVARAQLAGFVCETALLNLGSVPGRDTAWLQRRGYDLSVSQFRAIRPHLAGVPLVMRDLVLMSKALQFNQSGEKSAPAAKRHDKGKAPPPGGA